MKIDPNTQLGALYQEYELLKVENALKLTQILDLEIILYNTRTLNMKDGSPCWCCLPAITDDESSHDADCEKAREATSPLWNNGT